jgi:penicillin-binding protein 2
MRKDYRKNKLFNRRTVILTGIRTFLSSILVIRLGYLQLGKHKEYSTRSDKNRIKTIIQPALRGLIVDRNNKSLVNNRKNYRLLLYLENKSNIKNSIERLVKILDLDLDTKNKLLKRISNSRRKSIISLIDNLSWNDLAKVEVNSYMLPEFSIESAPVRYYPFPFETAHLIGYVSLPSEKEINGENKKLFMQPNFRIGKNGIEKSFDEYLRGKFGIKYSEVNAFGLPLRDISTVPSVDGGNLTLTIDIELQRFIFDKISHLTASVVVMDVKTGEILALNSSPSFDINNFVEGFTQQYWDSLINDEGRPLNNKPLTANYPPGSVFKLMVALAALEQGINPKKKIRCNGKYRLGKRIFHCWKEKGHGSLNMNDAIKNSCNIYFFHLANELGIDNITQMASRFGYGESFDVDLQEVTSAPLPSDKWKRKTLNTPWVGGDTLNSSIGQGFILASPIQIATATARIANGGIAIKPYLVKNADYYNQYEKLKDDKIVDQKHLNYVQKGMYRVLNESGGTATASKIRDKNFILAGKTGTSQVISKREKDMTEAEKKKNKNHAIFTGFAPFNDPKYAISVVVEHGGSGSKAAAPLAKKILEEVKRLNS